MKIKAIVTSLSIFALLLPTVCFGQFWNTDQIALLDVSVSYNPYITLFSADAVPSLANVTYTYTGTSPDSYSLYQSTNGLDPWFYFNSFGGGNGGTFSPTLMTLSWIKIQGTTNGVPYTMFSNPLKVTP